MNKLLTIGLAAAALAGGVAASSSPAMADDWNNRGYYNNGGYDHDRYDHDRYNRDHDWRWRQNHGYGYRGARCTHYWQRNWQGRLIRHVRCY